MNPNIFREYDIRGVADTDLTDDVVRNIGRAYGTYILRNGGRKVTVGRDVRLTSPRIQKAFIDGVLSAGCDVIDVGQLPTPVLYYSIVRFNADGGVAVTGSHNPIEYNGLKLCRGLGAIYGDDIQKLRSMIETGDLESGSGSLSREDPIPDYIDMVKSRAKIDRPLTIAIDAGNGCASEIAPKIFSDLGCEVIPLFCEIDGRFPNHLPDPTIPKYMEPLIAKVREVEVDFGVGYDGDADRIGVVDGNGKIIWGDRLLALYARDVLSRMPGSKIIFDVKCSQGLPEYIESHGGVPVMWKTGHSLIKEKMKEEGAPIAGEMSGHMFFADDYFGYDDAIYASVRLAGIVSSSGGKLSELMEDIPEYVSTPEVRISCPDEEKFQVVEDLKNYFRSRYDVIDVDGVRVLFGDGWSLIRPSNTQPVLVLRFEAKTKGRLLEIAEIVKDKLSEYPSVAVSEIELSIQGV